MHRHEGKYAAFIFDEPAFNKNQPQLLYKQSQIILWSEGCGLNGMNLQGHYKYMKEKYQEKAGGQMVGIGKVEIDSYMYYIGITAIPCLKITAVPLIVQDVVRVTAP